MQKPSRREFVAAGAAVSLAAHAAAVENAGLAGWSIKKASEQLRAKAVSPVELTEACLKRTEQLNPAINAYITILRDQAMIDARRMQEEQRQGKWRGPLHGVPIALKDNIDTAGVRTTGASELFKDRIPAQDSEVARRLKNAGAIPLGKLNLHEFAYGGSSTVTYFGAIHNPWALDRTTGGSSGGPGAAVAADMCFAALGTDTAGSVRISASYCGIVGLKPAYGRVSMRGGIPLSWTLDHVGPMCKTVEDTAIMLNAIAGYDELDPTTADVPVPDYVRALKTPTAKLRLGIPRVPFFEGLDPEVSKAVDAALQALRKLTAGAKDVKLPPGGNPAAIWTPEAYVYHAQWIAESPRKYQPSTRAALQRGADFKADVYIRARKRSGAAAARNQSGLRGCGSSHHAHYAQYRGATRRRLGRPQHVPIRRLRHSYDLSPLRLFGIRPAHWTSDRRRALGGRDRARAGSRL